jgi:hypothetical protein
MSEPRPTDSVPDVAEFDHAIQAYLDRMAALRYADCTISLIFSSDRWPPLAETALAEGPAYSYSVRLCGFPDGHLAVTLYRNDGATPLFTEFQRVALSEVSTFIIYLTVRNERVMLKVGRDQLGPYRHEQDPLEIQGTRKTD